MQLIINGHDQLKDVQAAFHKHYPYLKLEFFSNKHEASQSSPVTDMIDHNQYVSTFSAITETDIDMSADRKVQDFEHDVQQKLGIAVQVFRLSNKVWIETSKTDNWTLDQQNKKGEEMDHDLAVPKTYEQKLADNEFDNR